MFPPVRAIGCCWTPQYQNGQRADVTGLWRALGAKHTITVRSVLRSLKLNSQDAWDLLFCPQSEDSLASCGKDRSHSLRETVLGRLAYSKSTGTKPSNDTQSLCNQASEDRGAIISVLFSLGATRDTSRHVQPVSEDPTFEHYFSILVEKGLVRKHSHLKPIFSALFLEAVITRKEKKKKTWLLHSGNPQKATAWLNEASQMQHLPL